MNDMIFSPIDKRQLIQEIAEEVAARIIPELQPPVQEDELIQIPEAMKLLGRSRTTINNWRREGFLKEQVIKTGVGVKPKKPGKPQAFKRNGQPVPYLREDSNRRPSRRVGTIYPA
ncbi:helix-turn-helix transcriptional regulator [Cyclobacterium roseum]|uniref:helix-turn-helix transcriptional regulator n=1 Tax=Cyclobacterium roseum TaxID=2666137 RepID=UPI001F1F8F2D|nr:helix-turn-helix domain-containing protein [Cyclobacterium roseum]